MRFRMRSDQDFADEIGAHLDLETDRLIATGMAPAEARAAALRAFGNRTAVRERFHEARGRVLLEQLLQDLRYARRALRRTPGFALVAILCLGIGISVNTAAFSFLNAFMFRDFPGVVRQDELVSIQIGQETRWGRMSPAQVSTVEWGLLSEGLPAFSGIAASHILPLSVATGGEPQAVRGALVSANYFDLLGTVPAAGRFMRAADDPGDLAGVVVLSHAWWTRHFAARPDVVGQVLTIGTHPFTVVGVAPEGFFGLYPGEMIDPDVGAAEFFLPLAAAPLLRPASPSTEPATGLDDRWLQVIGRLRPGATLAEAEGQASAIAAQLAATWPVERPGAFAEIRTGNNRSRDAAELLTAMLFVMVVPAVILLVACANLANQLLARAIQRSREIAVRLSLGATRARVVRQLLVETALLAVLAGGLGVVLARWLLDALRAWALALPSRVPIDLRVLGFTLGLALLTALAFGLVPALRATRTDLAHALKEGAPGSGYRRSRLRSALVVVQIAASLALIAVSTVFVTAAQAPPSRAREALADRAILVALNLDLVGFDAATGSDYQDRVLERLAALPGVVAAGRAPFAMFDMLGGHPMTRAGQDPGDPDFNDLAPVSGDWFGATATTALRGRLFSPAERTGPPAVAVVDEVLASEMWGEADPLGQALRLGPDSAATLVTVIGVVPARQEVAYRQPEGVVFIPGDLEYRPRTFFYVRTACDAEAMVATVRQAVAGVDPRVPILWARTLEQVEAKEMSPLTLTASGLASLGVVALALAALGLFGVLSFIVAQRRHEIGVRVALGATRLDVTWMVVRQAVGLGAGGVVLGAALALAAVTLMRAVIHGLQPLDLPIFGAMSAAMVIVALVASALPARRAASVDPMATLRAE